MKEEDLNTTISGHHRPASETPFKLTTDVCLTADPGVVSLIPAGSHTFVEIDHEIISTAILFPSVD